ESGKYRDYLDMSLPISQVSPHRLLAMLRGARDGALSLHLSPLDEDGLAALEEQFIKGDDITGEPPDETKNLVLPCKADFGRMDSFKCSSERPAAPASRRGGRRRR
ncbi:MAG: hypothetical protein PHW08_05300, partial [Kiritimatiellae bacterium]|nr:hypothetical protein [Kiritimatiellia bacterium]